MFELGHLAAPSYTVFRQFVLKPILRFTVALQSFQVASRPLLVYSFAYCVRSLDGGVRNWQSIFDHPLHLSDALIPCGNKTTTRTTNSYNMQQLWFWNRVPFFVTTFSSV
jgi:hypothetical protein